MIRTRFAPSPTGYLHVGGLRTALYAYLFAKKNNGKFLLRIEDTDRERFVADGTLNILKSLRWAGIEPDEGVVLRENEEISERGEKGPYTQSLRLEIYKKYANELVKNKYAYHCFCKPERLEKLREEQQKRKQPTGYDQYCLKNIAPEESERRVASGEKHVIRLKMPKEGETKFVDLIRGEVVFKNELIDDQVLVKSDGFPTYHLAVVVDDHFMGITHVIRGEEWISSTPKHIQLYKYFGWNQPEFAHLPLLLNSDKSKLSKRQGDVAVADYEKKGYLSEALINFVVFLGWNPGGERELFTLNELEKEFDIAKVNKTGAVFNLEKLDWFNKEYIKKLNNDEFLNKVLPFLPETYKNDATKLQTAVLLEKDRIKTLAEITDHVKFLFEYPEYNKDLLVWRKGTSDEVKSILPKIREILANLSEENWKFAILEKSVTDFIAKEGLSNGSVLWPLRVALSGMEHSPGPYEIAVVLGRGETLKRIEAAMNK